MKISDQILSGERPLYASRDLQLSRVTIGEGESGLKESRHILAENCRFEGMYVIWECEDVTCRNCYFAPSDRAPLWYCRDLRLFDCLIDAPKAFREIDRLTLERIKITDGAEALWHCRGGQISDLRIEQGTYAFMHASQFQISNIQLQGKYIFQYARNSANISSSTPVTSRSIMPYWTPKTLSGIARTSRSMTPKSKENTSVGIPKTFISSVAA